MDSADVASRVFAGILGTYDTWGNQLGRSTWETNWGYIERWPGPRRVLVMDERVAEVFPGADGDAVEQLMCMASPSSPCLPDGLSHRPSAGTGTVMRPSTKETYAQEAGFSGMEILPIDNDLWRS